MPLNDIDDLERCILGVAPPHYASGNAPSTFRELKEWSRARVIGVNSLPVYGGGCTQTVYSCPTINHAFRAWHDCLHLRLDCGFSLKGELAVSSRHLEIARLDFGVSPRGLAVLRADTEGQIRYWHKYRQFVVNQCRFVGDCLMYGIDAVLDSGISY